MSPRVDPDEVQSFMDTRWEQGYGKNKEKVFVNLSQNQKSYVLIPPGATGFVVDGDDECIL